MSGSCLCGVDSEDAERDNVTAARSALRAPLCAFHRSTSRHTPILALAPRKLPEFAVNTFHSFHTRTLLLTTLRTLRFPKRPSPSQSKHPSSVSPGRPCLLSAFLVRFIRCSTSGSLAVCSCPTQTNRSPNSVDRSPPPCSLQFGFDGGCSGVSSRGSGFWGVKLGSARRTTAAGEP